MPLGFRVVEIAETHGVADLEDFRVHQEITVLRKLDLFEREIFAHVGRKLVQLDEPKGLDDLIVFEQFARGCINPHAHLRVVVAVLRVRFVHLPVELN